MAKNSTTRSPGATPVLTPPPAALKKALRQAANDARRLAAAFGAKIPTAKTTKADKSR